MNVEFTAQSRKCRRHHLGGYLACLRPAHSVRCDKKSEVFVHKESVFVVLPHQPNTW
jgi:hypothetical protein